MTGLTLVGPGAPLRDGTGNNRVVSSLRTIFSLRSLSSSPSVSISENSSCSEESSNQQSIAQNIESGSKDLFQSSSQILAHMA